MALSLKHTTFAEAIVEGLSPELAYQKAYPRANATTCRVNGYRLLQNATIESYIKEKSKKIEDLATNKAADELKNKIVRIALSVDERKRILEDIALGKLQQKSYEPVLDPNTGKWGTRPTAVSEPTIDHRIKAIAELNRMGGDYAPSKVAQTDSQGNDIDLKQASVLIEFK